MELIIGRLLSDLFLIIIFLTPATLLVGGVLLLAFSIKKNRISHYVFIIPILLFFIFVLLYFFLVVFDSSGFIRFIFTGAVIISTILSVSAAIIQFFYYRQKLKRNVLSIFFISALFVATSGILGRLASGIIIAQCEHYHIATGDIIVRSLESYYNDNKVYPNNFLELLPKYISKDSVKTCYSIPFGQNNLSPTQFEGFYYKKCSQGTTELIIPEMGAGGYHVYDLNEKTWYIYNGEPIDEFRRLINCQDGE
jgi:hypothetical protein